MVSKATTASKRKSSATLIPVPVCGLVPKSRTDRSMMKIRKERNAPTRKDVPVVTAGTVASSAAIETF
jgi:hypothetical protein